MRGVSLTVRADTADCCATCMETHAGAALPCPAAQIGDTLCDFATERGRTSEKILYETAGLSRADARKFFEKCGKSLDGVHFRSIACGLKGRVAGDLRFGHKISKIALLDRHKGGLALVEFQLHFAYRSVTMFFDEYLGNAVALHTLRHLVFAVYKHDDVGILLDRA